MQRKRARRGSGRFRGKDVGLFLLWTSGFLLFQRNRGRLWNARAEQIEAVTKTAGKDPGCEVGVADDVQAAEGSVVAPGHRGVEPRLLHVGIQIPAIAERDVEAGL